MSKKIISIILLITMVVILLILSIGVMVSQRLSVYTTNYHLEKPIASPITMVSLSDLHYPNNGIKMDRLEKELSIINPDLVFFTGDIFDDNCTKNDIDTLLPFFEKVAHKPTFYVIGNHEIGFVHYDYLLKSLENLGIKVLLNEYVTTNVKNTTVTIMGLNDASLLTIENIPNQEDIPLHSPKILLAHRAELFENYSTAPVAIKPDIVFSGHSHGGQIRIFNRGLYAPDQGFFPKYTSNKYTNNNTTMFVSRGLGDSSNDFRMFNSYHLIAVTISS